MALVTAALCGCGADSTPAAADSTTDVLGEVANDVFVSDTTAPNTSDTSTTSDTTVPDTGDITTSDSTEDADTSAPHDVADTADTPDVRPSTCPAVALTGPLAADRAASSYGLGFDGATDLGFGGRGPDTFIIEIWEDSEGTFDLASVDNADYLSCAQCVLVLVDLVGETPTAVYFQRSGSLMVTGLPSDGAPSFTLSDVILGEADADVVPIEGGFCRSITNETLTVTVVEGPTDWTCDPELYGDDSCDCGCGIPDLDCPDATIQDCEYCDACGASPFGSCVGYVDPADVTLCIDRPEPTEDWTCPTEWFADDDCDCGCGAQDFDCTTTTDVTECEYCLDCEGNGNCALRVASSDTTICELTPVVLPDGWRCEAQAFGDNRCDCGCGAQDLDCASTADVDACDGCDNCGSVGACDQRVEPTNTTVCVANPPELPAGWLCFDTDYGDGWCDCGCGAQDVDCETTDVLDECDFCFNCEGDASCSVAVDPADTTLCLP